MRDRLIELLDVIIQPGEKTLGDIADYLLENGVIVPPCKVGDYIWFIQNNRIAFGKVESITKNRSGLCAYVFEFDDCVITDEWYVPLCEVFLAREEAERALKGGAE